MSDIVYLSEEEEEDEGSEGEEGRMGTAGAPGVLPSAPENQRAGRVHPGGPFQRKTSMEGGKTGGGSASTGSSRNNA